MKLNKFIQVTIAVSTMLMWSCTWDQVEPKTDCSLSPIVLELVEVINSGCGIANGSFIVNATGGEPPYIFESTLGSNETGEFRDVAAGTYSINARDAKGCEAEITAAVQNLEGVNLEQVTTQESDCGSSNGTVEISVIGGTEPYSFSINNQTPQSSNIFTGLSHGDYSIKVVDNSGCEITSEAKITTGVSYETSIKNIIATNCAISNCHNGSISPNLTTFANIQSSASRIKVRTANRSMPRGRSLSQEQIDLIACWVDDGALQN